MFLQMMLAIIAIIEKNKLIGFNVSAGGGMGVTHGNAATYPRLAHMLGFVNKDDLLKQFMQLQLRKEILVIATTGNLARLKYTIDRMGIDAFKTETEKRSGIKFQPEKVL